MKLLVHINKADGLYNVELMGTSDPYCVCEAGKNKIKTATINNDLNPVWNFAGELDWDEKSDLVFTLYDENSMKKDAFMGKYVLPKDKVKGGFKGYVDLVVEHAEKKGQRGGHLDIEVVAEGAFFGASNVQAAPSGRMSFGSFSRPDLSTMVMENDVLMWKSPVKSAAMLGAVDTVAFVYFFFDIQFMSLLCNIGLLLTLFGGAARLGGVQLKEEQIDISGAQLLIRSLMASIAKFVNDALSLTVQVVFWEDQSVSTMVLMAVYVLSSILPLISIPSLLFMVCQLLFIVPNLYKKNQELIDGHVKPVVTQALAKKDELVAMIPKYSSLGKTD